MKQIYQFKPDEIDQIISRFGQNFYEKVLQALEVYADRWRLTSFQLVPSYSANLVFTCHAAKYGDAVLKIGGVSSGETLAEFHALSEYKGRRFCSVFEADMEHGILLEERVVPGIALRHENSLERRLEVFCSLYRDLHVAPADSERYPTYAGWVTNITNYMSTRTDCSNLYAYMKKAQKLCLSLSAMYPQQLLLHGDLHHDNILLGADGAYTIIDPKGVLGDPIFDVPRFILNEFEEGITLKLEEKINTIIRILEQSLRIPNAVLRQCLYIETAMAACWTVESGATYDRYAQLAEEVAFAERLMEL
ncbi:aminoglycoside phosphotransferase family protein [Paenibacillus sp. GCM10012307]|uniref:Phosphotransferase n=1 Tax=Paenibacillus roseus TaxID=2798579 RepID=A0A934MRC9_9BACL|nr:aminoglycoside phosphotransferase family protein [Paenibacillus roseus]MBJ6362768.1 phosphotransferase [Paenibacillus roseus]